MLWGISSALVGAIPISTAKRKDMLGGSAKPLVSTQKMISNGLILDDFGWCPYFKETLTYLLVLEGGFDEIHQM